MFERARRLDPCCMDGVDIYSTALWQLKQEVKLAFLAQQVGPADDGEYWPRVRWLIPCPPSFASIQTLSLARLTPEPWIAIGNCFSLQKEHDTAIKFFQRAIQLDPDRAYAHTLMAHEFIANEDFDKAVSGFRHAVRIDERHYNAWSVGRVVRMLSESSPTDDIAADRGQVWARDDLLPPGEVRPVGVPLFTRHQDPSAKLGPRMLPGHGGF